MKKMPLKIDKTITRRRKFINVEVPITKSKIEVTANLAKELKGRTVKLDLTRQLKGKSVEVIFKIEIENEKAVARPIKIKLMPYFIRRMIRKRISYVEDSFLAPSQESMILIKPFLITRKKVSRAVRKTLRNKCKNWIEDYIAEKKDQEIFSEVLSNRMQKSLSLYLKKTYPLSLCEIRILEITRQLAPEEIPEIKEKSKEEEKPKEEFIDQMEEIENEKLKQAEKEIKETQQKAAEIESSKTNVSAPDLEKPEPAEKIKKTRMPRKKKEEKIKETEEKTEQNDTANTSSN